MSAAKKSYLLFVPEENYAEILKIQNIVYV